MTSDKPKPAAVRSLRPDGTPEPDAAPRPRADVAALEAQIEEAREALEQWENTVGEMRTGPSRPPDQKTVDSKGGWDEMRLKLAEAAFVTRPDGWPADDDDDSSKGNC